MAIVGIMCALVGAGCLLAIRLRRQELRRPLDATDKRLALVALVACIVIVVLLMSGYLP
jgi:hypothetical protein